MCQVFKPSSTMLTLLIQHDNNFFNGSFYTDCPEGQMASLILTHDHSDTSHFLSRLVSCQCTQSYLVSREFTDLSATFVRVTAHTCHMTDTHVYLTCVSGPQISHASQVAQICHTRVQYVAHSCYDHRVFPGIQHPFFLGCQILFGVWTR